MTLKSVSSFKKQIMAESMSHDETNANIFIRCFVNLEKKENQ